MAQAGVPVPVDEDSTFQLFDAVFADIGDEQSIVQNLSTFTGHLNQMNEILHQLERHPDWHALVLLDELGTGTDPLEGGALACAVLEELAACHALTIATTHLGSIKAFAHDHQRMMNAAVRFNMETLQPEYALDIGNPGSSHALRIAERLGLKANVLEAARAHLGTDQLQLEGMIAELESQRRQIEQQQNEAQRSLEVASQDRDALQQELEELKAERKKKLHDAYVQAEQIVANTRRQMEQLIADVSRAQNEETTVKDAARAARRKVDQKQKRLDKAVAETQSRPKQPVALDKLRPGDHVWVEKLGANAVVENVMLERKQVVVRVGQIDFTVRATQIGQPDETKPPTQQPRVIASRPQVRPSTKPDINLIGKRVDEATQLLQRFMDDAALAGLTEIRVIHGLGTGRLKKGVHDVLKTRPEVAAYREGIEGKDSGGAGVTIVDIASH